MCWQCDNPDGTIEEYLDILRRKIRSHRWAIQFVEDGRRAFAYTVGLHDSGLPELLITGLCMHTAGAGLNAVAEMMLDDGMALTSGVRIYHEGKALFEIVEVEHLDVHLTYAVALCGPNIRAFQLVWADDRERWPWDAGWDQGRRLQPVFGVRASMERSQ